MRAHWHIDERLEQVEFFRGRSAQTLRQVTMLGTPIERTEGAELTRQGRRGVELVLLLEGSVRIERDGELVAERVAGEFLGEISVLGGGLQTATATVTEPVSALVVGKPDVWTLLAEVPGLRNHLRDVMAERLGRLPRPVVPAPGAPLSGSGRVPQPAFHAG